MAGFRRVFKIDPGLGVLSDIESMNIIDVSPPAQTLGAGTGTVCVVGEFEKGPLNSPLEVFGGQDLEDKFGGFGFIRLDGPSQDPVARKSGGDEFWNGNGFIALRNKRFYRLIVVRVDNSAGEVAFTRLACHVGGANASYDLDPGDTVEFTPDGGAPETATFDADAAQITGVGGTYPTGFVGGETLELKIGTTLEEGATQVVTFTATEQTLVQVIDYINAHIGSPIASDDGGELKVASIVQGTGARIEIVGGTALATLGFVPTVDTGTGDVFNIDRVTPTEFKTVVDADCASYTVDTTPDGQLRVCNTATTDGTGTSEASGGTALEKFGFTLGEIVNAADGSNILIPAGTRVRDSITGEDWVTLQDIETGTGGGPFTALVRPKDDDNATPDSAIGDIDTIIDSLADGFVVTNAAVVSRLSDVQLDVAYENAIDSTLDISGVPYEIQSIVSARASINIGLKLKLNALEATKSGHRARKAIVSPRLGTAREVATGDTGQGVGNLGREERVFYLFPGVAHRIPEIAAKGLQGGIGFTDDGVVSVHADMWYASVRSILPPEENAGQRLTDTNVGLLPILALEDAYNPEEGGIGLTVEDYKNFKREGVIAGRFDRTAGFVFQSDVTSVDPEIELVLADAKRRFFADFIIDSIGDIAINFVKKLNTPARRRAFIQQINEFLRLLQAPNTPETSRLDEFSVEDTSTPDLIALGFMNVAVKVRQYQSMDFIVAKVEVGATVTIENPA